MRLRGILLPVAALVFSGATELRAALPAAQTPNEVRDPLFTLRDLVQLCESRDDAIATCAAYLSGFIHGIQETTPAFVAQAAADEIQAGCVRPDGASTEQAIARLTKKFMSSLSFCMDSPWTAGYVAAVVGQYGREHEDLLDEAAHDHMLRILTRAFPCDKHED